MSLMILISVIYCHLSFRFYCFIFAEVQMTDTN